MAKLSSTEVWLVADRKNVIICYSNAQIMCIFWILSWFLLDFLLIFLFFSSSWIWIWISSSIYGKTVCEWSMVGADRKRVILFYSNPHRYNFALCPRYRLFCTITDFIPVKIFQAKLIAWLGPMNYCQYLCCYCLARKQIWRPHNW